MRWLIPPQKIMMGYVHKRGIFFQVLAMCLQKLGFEAYCMHMDEK
jgi:hypothetical protein